MSMRQKNTKQMLSYWLDLFWEAGNLPGAEGPQKWPERSAIQPSQCRSLLSSMFILENEHAQINYRLAGTMLCSLYGRELKRESFAEAFLGQDQRSAESWVHRLGKDDYVVLICSVGENSDGERVNLETLLMPLSQHGGRGNRILGITTPCDQPEWLGTSPIIGQTIKSVRVLRPWEDDENTLSNIMSTGNVSDFPSRRTELDAPALFSDEHRPEQEDKADRGTAWPRQVGHLTVIDGGLD